MPIRVSDHALGNSCVDAGNTVCSDDAPAKPDLHFARFTTEQQRTPKRNPDFDRKSKPQFKELLCNPEIMVLKMLYGRQFKGVLMRTLHGTTQKISPNNKGDSKRECQYCAYLAAALES